MLNLIMKLIICPIVVAIAGSMLTNVNFSHVYQPIVIGATLAVAGHLLEWALLSRNTFWFSTITDFVFSTLIIYILGYFFFTAQVTFFGAVVTALLLTLVEFFVHMWLIRSGRARKEMKLG
ncbi:DUF2512 family protein [Siminovitchia fortis]|uniref:DUF2512 family protein n=1 Tax=Siminovitchia fortis TaxID=254758 RepID=A0A443IZM0_9BACI|nr:DUF2512 family protein [Siminovitchia fortis]RWR13607.1 DUF2512 family protein [Siminovitchia fortis]WHY81936.1 DUF2512 family protein [Siminovitchia fortis]